MKRALIIIFLFLVGNNITAQTKKEQKEKAFQSNKTIVESNNYYFNATSVTNRIGTTSDIRNMMSLVSIKGMNIEVDLPHIGSDSTRTRTVCDNKIIKYDVKYNERKKKITISCTTNCKTENLELRLTISENNKANLSIYGRRIERLNYYGIIAKNN